MEHFYTGITGWFSYPHLYADMVNKFPSGSHFVEVGSYEGCSLAYLIVEIINAKKDIKVTAVDSFAPIFGANESTFHNNMKPVQDKFDLIIGQSWVTADMFEDKSLDFVFIDADHVYESVKKDIIAWLPKVKSGGVLAGHDYPAFIGVKQVVDEMFGDKHDRKYAGELCWYVPI